MVTRRALDEASHASARIITDAPQPALPEQLTYPGESDASRCGFLRASTKLVTVVLSPFTSWMFALSRGAPGVCFERSLSLKGFRSHTRSLFPAQCKDDFSGQISTKKGLLTVLTLYCPSLYKEVHLLIPYTSHRHRASDSTVPRGALLDRIKESLKNFCREIYSRAVYCRDCGYEVGENPECPTCVKTRRR